LNRVDRPDGDDASAMAGPATGTGGATSARPTPGSVAAEKETARREFHRDAGKPGPAPAGPGSQSAALRAFFVANAGRGLLPSSETSGVINPNLRTEEA